MWLFQWVFQRYLKGVPRLFHSCFEKFLKLFLQSIFFCNSFTYPYSWGEDDEDSVNNNKEGEKAEKEEPEPDENVDFFIH